MIVRSLARVALVLSLLVDIRAASAQETATGEQYSLRYRFQPGQRLRWSVEHQTNVRTTVSGTTQTVDALTRSVKVWQVVEVRPDGTAVLENSVEQVNLRQQTSGRDEVRYDSRQDPKAPPGFEEFAQSIGVPLFHLTVDAHGAVVDRRQLLPHAQDSGGQLTVPLPAEPVSIGHVWSVPHEIAVTLKTGEVKKVQTRQRFELRAVENGLATIGVETQILNPALTPEVQVQVIQRALRGQVEFDIEAGQIVRQQLDLDEQVVGFNGEASSMRYVTRFTETLLNEAAQTARAPAAAAAQ